MTAILFAWMAEIVLEAIGAFLYRRRSPLLSSLLAFCALSDAAAYLLRSFLPATWIYFWAGWGQHEIRNLMLVWLACSICGMFVAEKRKSIAMLSTAFLSFGSFALVTAFAFSGDTLKDRILNGEIAATMILLALVCAGWISRRDRLTGIWKWIVAGFVVMVGSDWLFTVLWTHWDGARHWYPAGALIAYAIWCVGPLRNAKLPEFRKSLPNKYPHIKEVHIM